MGGWLWDGDDVDERTLKEAENATRQARRLTEMIRSSVVTRDFSITIDNLRELNILAVEGLAEHPGELRKDDVIITGSKHVPPPWQSVPTHLDDMLRRLNSVSASDGGVYDAAYALWRINWIHPFEDGNGRTARAVAYFLLHKNPEAKHQLPGDITVVERLSWQRIAYVRALEDADRASVTATPHVLQLAMLLLDLMSDQLRDAFEGLKQEVAGLNKEVGLKRGSEHDTEFKGK